MKRSNRRSERGFVLVAIGVAMIGCMPASALDTTTWLIDLGRNNGTDGSATTSPDANGNHWNNIQSATQATTGNRTANNLVNTTNGASTISVELTGDWQSNGRLNGGLFGTNGPGSSLLGDLAIETATEDYYFLSGAGSTGMVRITGLEVGRTYHIMLLGSRNTAVETRKTRFTSGSRVSSLITSGNNIGSNGSYDGNDSRVAGLFGLSPSTGGVVDIQVDVEQGDFGYINAIKIQRNLTEKEAMILIDFGPAGGRHSVGASDANGHWWSYVTGVTGLGGNITNLTTAANVTSSVDIALNWTGEVGVNGDPLVNWAIVSGEVYPGLNDSLFGFFDVVKNGVFFNSSLTPSIVLGGLDNSKAYDLTFYGARGNFTRTTTYSVGSSNVTLQTGTSPSGWNTGTVAKISRVVPSSGSITINLSATGGFGYLSAMQIESVVPLTLSNTVAMLGGDGVTPLTGNSSAGSLVQLIAVGANNAINLPSTNSFGSPDGDDYLVEAANNPTHVGAGMGIPDLGQLLQTMTYNESLAGLPVFIRYWNTDSPAVESLYGDTAVFYLPSAGIPSQTKVDFLPAGSSPPITSFSIPTLGEWAMICLFGLIAVIGYHRLRAANGPARSPRMG
jgi:hypothetical protein